MLNKKQHEKMQDILENVGPNIGVKEALALQVKMMALQTQLFDVIASELTGIERCLERIASKKEY